MAILAAKRLLFYFKFGRKPSLGPGNIGSDLTCLFIWFWFFGLPDTKTKKTNLVSGFYTSQGEGLTQTLSKTNHENETEMERKMQISRLNFIFRSD